MTHVRGIVPLLTLLKFKIILLLNTQFEPAFPTQESITSVPKLFGVVPILSVMRFDFFIFVCLGFLALELLFPSRYHGANRWSRARALSWVAGALLTFLGYFTLFVATGFCYGVALALKVSPLDLFGKLGLGLGERIVVMILAMDFGAFFLHFCFHKVRPMWAVHRVHHIAKFVDMFATNRLHPLESVLFGVMLFLAVFITGCNVLELVVALNIIKAFTVYLHSDWRLPFWLEKRVGVFVMTSGHHHIHHDKSEALHNSNFGLITTMWDRLFKTYRSPEKEILYDYGLPGYDGERTGLFRLLSLRLLKIQK